MDVAYLVRPGDPNEELKYSLRSVHANYAKLQDVWIIGHRPEWCVNVRHVPTKQRVTGSKRANLFLGFEALAKHGPLDFVLMNDDFFVMHRCQLFPTYHRTWPAQDTSPYSADLQHAHQICREITPRPRCLDKTHTPIPMRRAQLARVLAVAANRGHRSGHGLRSLYGALSRIQSVPGVDTKNRSNFTTARLVSTDDRTFRNGPIGEHIRQRFPNPSPYEGDT